MKRKHKIIAFFPAVMMVISLAACGGNATPEGTQGESASADTEIAPEEIPEDSGAAEMEEMIKTVDELKDVVTVVDITADNWKDYFDFETETITDQSLIGDESIHSMDVLELKPLFDEEKVLIIPSNGVSLHFIYESHFVWSDGTEYDSDSENYISYYGPSDDLRALAVTAADADENSYTSTIISLEATEDSSGTLYLFNLPEDWWNVDEDGNKFVSLDLGNTIDGFGAYTRFYQQPKKSEDSSGEISYHTSEQYVEFGYFSDDPDAVIQMDGTLYKAGEVEYLPYGADVLQDDEEDAIVSGEEPYYWLNYTDNERQLEAVFVVEE